LGKEKHPEAERKIKIQPNWLEKKPITKN